MGIRTTAIRPTCGIMAATAEGTGRVRPVLALRLRDAGLVAPLSSRHDTGCAAQTLQVFDQNGPVFDVDQTLFLSLIHI